MIIRQERIFSDIDSSVSIVFVDDVFECFFIEDEHRAHKVPKETRIPAGSYRIKLRTIGSFHHRYELRFIDFHEGMLCLQNVPNFEHILIHCGNHEGHTAGCLLANTGAYVETGSITGQASARAYERLYLKVVDAAKDNQLFIDIVDRDI